MNVEDLIKNSSRPEVMEGIIKSAHIEIHFLESIKKDIPLYVIIVYQTI